MNRKTRLIPKFMTPQPGKQTMQTIAIYILPNISRSKGNPTIKFGQIIAYNRSIFLETSLGKLVPEPFPKSEIKHITESIV